MAATRPRRGDALAAEAAALGPWFHNLHLPDGVQTAPGHVLGDFPAFKWNEIGAHVPRDLDGWSVLDIGCNAGYYSFELARRGAEVTAIDVDPHYLRQARWAAGVLGLSGRVTFRQMQVYELAREQQRYDLVWFMGVLYHLRHPLLALDIARQKTRRMLVLQTLTMPGREVATPPADMPLDAREPLRTVGWPAMAFIEHRLAGDPTNWWAANHACVEAMLRSSGFAIDSRIADETWLCTPATTAADDPMAQVVAAELRAATGAPALD